MKKNILLLILLVLVFSSAFATKHNHTDENEVRYVKKNVELNPQYQQQLRNAEMWQNFMTQNPHWFVIFNENNQMPHRAFGAPIQINDLFSFLAISNFDLPSDLRERPSTKNDKYINKTYVQYYNNLEVVNSKLYAKFSLANELISFGLDIFNDINISIVPTINEQGAIASATSDISALISDIIVNENLKVLANPKYRKHEYNLVYVVKFKTRIDEGPAHYICYVDAHTGELLMRKNEVMYEAPPITTNVSGDVYTTHPYNPASSENFKYLKAIDQSSNTNYYTDVNGDVDFGSVASGTSIRYKLEGLYADVQTNNNTPDIFANLGATNNIIFDNSNSTIQERTAYYAVNEVHDHLKNVFPTFTGLDSPLETNVDEQGSCNAYFAGTSLNFYAEGNGCQATAKITDVVFHEYAHAINNARYNSGSGMWNGAMNEGFADVWALSLTQSPVLGFGWDLVDPTIYIRRYDQDRKVYPQDLFGEVHADGEIIAGCFWDTYLNLGNMTQMLDLFKYTYDSGVDGPDGTEGVIYTDILLEVLFADDNDANLSNGTPNDIAIVSAFALHGITLLSNAVISHNPVSSAVGNTGITINASVGITYPWALGSANCFYRLNDATIWNNLTMSGVSSFTTTIPAQPNGTVIAYYISLTDNYGNESGITPMAANLTPLNNANLPYFIMVGYELLAEEDFDFNIGFWQTGDVNDNATTGMWEIGDPLGSYSDPGDPNTIVQTEDQHTVGGSNCAFTGNASSASASIGENDVDGGHTTLFSPYYDMTGYINPAFSYWRWYTNSPASGANPGADWWQVLITDDGVNWHYVENNMSSDISWRRFAFRVKDYVNLTNIVQLKFIASDSIHLGQNLDGGSIIEGAIDDLMLYDQESFVYNGCTDTTACNYDASSTVDDGSCEWTSCTCANDPISGLGVTHVIHNRATFTFDDMNTYDAMGVQVCRVDQLRIQYREVGTSSWSQKNMGSPTGYDPITGICNSTTNTAKLVLGLTSATTYEWRMKVWYCGIGNSGWVSGSSFTTLGDCPNVGNLSVSTPTTTKATFTWDDSNGPYSFVRIKSRVDTTNGVWFNVGGVGVPYGIFTKNKNNLSPGTSYRAQARTWCNPNGGAYKSPGWTPLIYWTMPTVIRLEGGTTIANLEVYPNPSRDVFNVTFTSETIQDLKVRILNLIGEELINEELQQFIGEYTKQIDLSNNAKGIYFLEIETNIGVINKKLILQ